MKPRYTPSLRYPDPGTVYDCAFLAQGVDTLEESASVYVLPDTWEKLKAAKEYAQSKNTGDNQGYPVTLGGMAFQIKPHGGAGVAFILSNDLVAVDIRQAEVQYNLSVKYSAGALWRFGPDELRKIVWDALLMELKPRCTTHSSEDQEILWRKLSVIHWAFDFHSPQFSQEIGPEIVRRFVCHQEAKLKPETKNRDEYGNEVDSYTMGTCIRTQTVTIGKKNSLQIQVYNKTDEITEKSQKTWMYEIWGRAGLQPDTDGKFRNVWRIECRYGREYLSVRNIDTYDDFLHYRENLLTEALATRRLVTPVRHDTNRRRWPLHPLWAQAIELSGHQDTFVPLGRHCERAADVVMAEAVSEIKAAMRRISVLKTGDFDTDFIWRRMNLILENMADDENHSDAIEKYQERYRYIDSPK